MKKDRIEELIAEQEGVTNEALKNALTRQIQMEQTLQEERLFKQLQAAKEVLSRRVQVLREIRAREKQALEAVKSCDAAYQQFKKDGNYNEFLKNA